MSSSVGAAIVEHMSILPAISANHQAMLTFNASSWRFARTAAPAVLSLCVLVAVVGGPQEAHALNARAWQLPAPVLERVNTASPPLLKVQQRRQISPLRGLFRALTGTNRARRSTRPRSPTNRAAQPRGSSSTGGQLAAPTITGVQKDPNAAKILVIGDLLAEGLAGGLVREFQDDPMIKVIARIERWGGLAKRDPINWQEALAAHMDEVEPHAVVVTLGLNDRVDVVPDPSEQVLVPVTDQAADLEEAPDIDEAPPVPAEQRNSEPNSSDRDLIHRSFAFGSARWNAAYFQRVASLVRLVRDRRLPLIWVGLGPAEESVIRSDFRRLNGRFRDAVVENGGAFIDIWRPFLDEAGNYTGVGPDKRGNTAQLRAPDGITYTQAGYDKIAFFVGRPARRFLSQMGVLFALQSPEATGVAGTITGRVISLTRPVAAATDPLAGEAHIPLAEQRAERLRRQTQEATIAVALPELQESLEPENSNAAQILAGLVERGELPLVPGRVDAFRGLPAQPGNALTD